MKIFYLDNFRGFQKSIIPLIDVNFCVGENSTGKTSFLALVNLLSSPTFWIQQSIELGESALGHFDDIVSINSSDKTYFRIGIVETVSNDEGDKDLVVDEARGFLFTYKNVEGMPRLHKCTHNFEKDVVTVTFSEKSTRYQITVLDTAPTMAIFKNGLLKKWVANHEQKIVSGYKILTDEVANSGDFPRLYSLSLIYNLELRTKGKRKGGRFFIPGPLFGGDVAWIAPIRTKPRRTYDEVRLDYSPEGEHTPYLMKKILDSKTEAKTFKKFMERFGKESGLFKKVNVHRFGSSVTSPFEVEVILEAVPLNIGSVGYGVSQGLPVIVELFVRESGTWFAVQQPEVHLHPRAQAAIGELIYELASNEDKKFIVETHSDFTIDRYRVKVRTKGKSHDGQILFFERKGGVNIVHPINFTESGDLEDKVPTAYRDFFLKESMQVIGI